MDHIFCSEELAPDHLLAVEVLLEQADGELSRGFIDNAWDLLRQAEQLVQAHR